MSQSQKQFYFYSPEGLSLVKDPGSRASALFRAAGHALAQRGADQAELYATDMQGSVLRLIDHGVCSMQYSAYGHDGDKLCTSVLRYCGQRKESAIPHYLLGDGYRAFNSVSMRFNTPDSFSPFGAGGINPYSYCGGDPVNNTDPSGHMMNSIFGSRSRRISAAAPSVSPVKHKKQADFNNRMNERLKTHNKVVYENSFEKRLAYLGRDTGVRMDELTRRTEFNQNDRAFVKSVTVSVSRDAQRTVNDLLQNPPSTQSDSRLATATEQVDLLADVESIQQRGVASMTPSINSWLHSKNVSTRRKAG